MDILFTLLGFVLLGICKLVKWVFSHSLFCWLAKPYERKNCASEFVGAALCSTILLEIFYYAFSIVGINIELLRNDVVCWSIVFASGIINAILSAYHNSIVDKRQSTRNEAKSIIVSNQNLIENYERLIQDSNEKEANLTNDLQQAQSEYDFACRVGAFIDSVSAAHESEYERCILTPIKSEVDRINALIEREQSIRSTHEHAIKNCKKEIAVQNKVLMGHN